MVPIFRDRAGAEKYRDEGDRTGAQYFRSTA
jgi:hypothetical protein